MTYAKILNPTVPEKEILDTFWNNYILLKFLLHIWFYGVLYSISINRCALLTV